MYHKIRCDNFFGFQGQPNQTGKSSGDRLSHRGPASSIPVSAAMEEEVGPGADMEALVRRLRLHRPAPSPYELSAAVAPAPAPGAGELFRPRRAAVLVCLFRGAAGELRVILTKRSSSLSTHSGEHLALFFVACLLLREIDPDLSNLV